jgi:WD40 repeat protein
VRQSAVPLPLQFFCLRGQLPELCCSLFIIVSIASIIIFFFFVVTMRPVNTIRFDPFPHLFFITVIIICHSPAAGFRLRAVNSVAFSTTAPLFATGSNDKTAKLWRISLDGTAATCVATLTGHSNSVLAVAFHPTAPLFATGSSDDTAKLWN